MFDSVIEQVVKSLSLIQGRLEFEEKKLAGIKPGMFDSQGNPRQSIIEEASSRKISIEELTDRVKNLKTSLEYAKSDLPRRDRERARAAEIETRILTKRKDRAALVESLALIDLSVSELEEEKSEAILMSSSTAKDLKLQTQDEEARIKKDQEEAFSLASSQLKGAQMELESGKKDQLPAQYLQEREKRVAIYKRKVEELSNV